MFIANDKRRKGIVVANQLKHSDKQPFKTFGIKYKQVEILFHTYEIYQFYPI